MGVSGTVGMDEECQKAKEGERMKTKKQRSCNTDMTQGYSIKSAVGFDMMDLIWLLGETAAFCKGAHCAEAHHSPSGSAWLSLSSKMALNSFH